MLCCDFLHLHLGSAPNYVSFGNSVARLASVLGLLIRSSTAEISAVTIMPSSRAGLSVSAMPCHGRYVWLSGTYDIPAVWVKHSNELSIYCLFH